MSIQSPLIESTGNALLYKSLVLSRHFYLGVQTNVAKQRAVTMLDNCLFNTFTYEHKRGCHVRTPAHMLVYAFHMVGIVVVLTNLFYWDFLTSAISRKVDRIKAQSKPFANTLQPPLQSDY